MLIAFSRLALKSLVTIIIPHGPRHHFNKQRARDIHSELVRCAPWGETTTLAP